MLHTLHTAARITLRPRDAEAAREARALDYLCQRLARRSRLSPADIRAHLLAAPATLRAAGVV